MPAAHTGAAVRRLRLTAFRCYRQLRLDVDPRPVVLTGPNGAGKTNILEALSFLAPGSGLRRARAADVHCRAETGGWAVAASVDGPGGQIDIGTGRDPANGGERRKIRIDGETSTLQSALAEHLHVLWLTPQMDRLFTDSAATRRRFLDQLVQGLEPGHARELGAYQRCLRERLRLVRAGGADPAWLDALEHTMAGHAIAVAAARRDGLARLREPLALGVGPFPGAELGLAGGIEDWLDRLAAVDAEAELAAQWARGRAADAEAGATALGPHRTDLVVRNRANGLAADQCSTGEQKLLLIGIVLANARLHTVRAGRTPLLLLDEVAAHLDQDRRAGLIDEICALGAQAWMTGTDRAHFARLADRAQYFAVADATVSPEMDS